MEIVNNMETYNTHLEKKSSRREQYICNTLNAECPFIRNGRYVCVSVYICVYVEKRIRTIYACICHSTSWNF